MRQSGAGTGACAAGTLRTPEQADALVVATIQEHADTLLRVARRYSLGEDDAADAYQRALEILVRHARRLDAGTAHRWLFRVVRNEALTVREQRTRNLAMAVEPDDLEARHVPSPEERALARERLGQATEALAALKPDELRALWLQASGHSYAEIAAGEGWTHTKVNRSLVEGRRRAQARRAAIETGDECARWAHALGVVARGATLPPPLALHLRHCAACQRAARRAAA